MPRKRAYAKTKRVSSRSAKRKYPSKRKQPGKRRKLSKKAISNADKAYMQRALINSITKHLTRKAKKLK